VAHALRRRPRLRTALVATLAVLCGIAVATTVRDAEARRAAWGRPRAALVATVDLRPGDRLEASNTSVVEHPAPVVADGALADLPPDARVAQPVYAGEVVREQRLAPAGASALAARVEPGARAVAVPVEPGTVPRLEPGDRVEVLVSLPVEGPSAGPPGFALASDVPVVDVAEAAVTIAVSAEVAPRLAAALGQGAVTLALLRGEAAEEPRRP
jgi:Flp pilus assembly protein CpaB